LIESTWEEQALVNQPVEEFNGVRAHFMLNLDETCMLASNSNLRIIADDSRKNKEKMTTEAPLPLWPRNLLAKGKALLHRH
jgi:hypothetical protein